MGLILQIHIVGASIALLAGAMSFSVRKGGRLHRMAGRSFVCGMLVMAMSALFLAISAGKWLDVCSSLLAAYLVLSSWATVKPFPRPANLAISALGLIALVAYLWVEYAAIQSGIRRPDVPPGVGFVFATVLGFALIGDLRSFRGMPSTRQQILIRHLWRMSIALLLATVSFFVSRVDLFPTLMQETGLLTLLGLAPLLAMLYWMVVIRLLKKVPLPHVSKKESIRKSDKAIQTLHTSH